MLFRPQVLEEERFRLYGKVSVPCKAPYMLCGVCVIGLVAVLVYLAATMTYTEREAARGYLLPDRGIVRVRAPRAGVIDAVFAGRGSTVSRGDPLLLVISESRGDAGTAFSASVAMNLHHRHQELEAQFELAGNKKALMLDRVSAERETLRMELAVADTQVATQQKWLAATRERVEAYRTAGRAGSVPQLEVRRLEAEVLTGELQLHTLERQRLILKGSLTRNGKQRQDVIAEHHAATSAIRLARLDLEDLELDNDRSNAQLVTAPMDGTIVSHAALPGTEVTAGKELMVVAPSASRLVAHIFVPAAAIGFVRAGQRVALQYDSFPHREFGLFPGTVVEVSDFVFDRRELDVELTLTQPVFRVVTVPDTNAVQVYGTPVALKPGMTLEAQVETRTLTVGEWILAPLFALRDAPFERGKGHQSRLIDQASAMNGHR